MDIYPMKLSIITINLNNKDGLRKTIESVVSQTFSDYEYIVIDGASTDGSVEVIKEYEDKITYWVSEPDKGIYNAMNKGILQAKGEYLVFMNSGDCFIKDILLQIFQFHFTEDILYGNIIQSYADRILRRVQYPNEKEISLFYFYQTTLCHQASFIKKKLLATKMYSEEYKIVSDWAFFLEKIIFQGCSIKHLNMDVANVEAYGLSYNIDEIQLKERREIFDQKIPYHMRKDYDLLYQYHSSPLSKLVLRLRKTSGFEKIVYKILSVLIKLYSLFRKI